MADPLPPPDDALARARSRELERGREHDAAARLSRVHGAHELQAALLALLLPPGSKRALVCWRIETESTLNAQALLDDVQCLGAETRLPWFETLLARMAAAPLEERQSLVASTRRLMGARGRVRPIDRLHWLVMRQRLGEPAHYGPRTGADAEISQLHESAVVAIATYSAFLARMVPDAESSTAGPAWYATVMAPWQHRADVPACVPPTIDALVTALYGLRALPWMQRPVVVRGWVAAGVKHSRHGQLDDTAADALRLSCRLLDSPLPPDLAEHYIEPMVDANP
jgi:hypothetical protein